MVAVLAAALPLAYLPNVLLALALFGDPQLALDIMLQPLPGWAVVLSVAFPLSIAFAELPLYFGYAMPRLAARTGRPYLSLLACALFLAAQHIALPLVFDLRFILWRLLMFLPFAIFVGWVLLRRPGLMPYLVVTHALLDAAMVAMLFPLASW
jgi:hypothetical protein